MQAAPSTPSSTNGPAAQVHDWTPRIAVVLNRFVHTVAKHWLLMVNTAVGLYAGLTVLAPTLMVTGHPWAARLIYTLFRLACHQLPERSFFLFGPRLAYTLDQLERIAGPNVPPGYLGSPTLGYKMAICQRDTAILLAVLVAGVAFALLRHRLRPLSMRAFLLSCVPIAVDGFGQLLGLWESTWWSRVATGALFGVACVWLAYPLIEMGMNDVLQIAEKGRSQKERH